MLDYPLLLLALGNGDRKQRRAGKLHTEKGGMMTKHAIIYDRASSEGQKDNWSRDDAQRVGAELAQQHGYTWELRQEVKSGEELANRPVMREVLDDIADDRVQAIIVQNLARLSRDEDTIDGKIIRRICRQYDCLVITPQKVYDFSLDTDDDMADLVFLQAKWYKRDMVKNLTQGMKAKARQGRQITGYVLFGYKRVYEPRLDQTNRPPISRVVIEEEEASIVRLAFDKYLDLGSATKTANWLNEQGHSKPIKSKRTRERYGLGEGRPFKSMDIIRMVKNPLYPGWATWGKECTSRHMRDFEAQWSHRPELQIVDQDTWERANAQQRRNSFAPKRAIGSGYAFSLLLKCKSCGGGLAGTTHSTRGRRHKQYRCDRRSKSGRSVCDTGHTMYQSVVARAVLPLAADLIERGLNLKAAMREAAQEMTHATDEVLEQTWRAELAEVERQTKNLVAAIAQGIITAEQARETSQELAERKGKLARNLSRIHEKAKIQGELLEAVKAIEGDVEGVLWLLLENQPRTLNQVLSLIFERKSILVECWWGETGKRESKVTDYKLTERFADTLSVGIAEGDRSP